MTVIRLAKSIPQCEMVQFGPLSSQQIPSALLSYQQIQPDYAGPNFSPQIVVTLEHLI